MLCPHFTPHTCSSGLPGGHPLHSPGWSWGAPCFLPLLPDLVFASAKWVPGQGQLWHHDMMQVQFLLGHMGTQGAGSHCWPSPCPHPRGGWEMSNPSPLSPRKLLLAPFSGCELLASHGPNLVKQLASGGWGAPHHHSPQWGWRVPPLIQEAGLRSTPCYGHEGQAWGTHALLACPGTASQSWGGCGWTCGHGGSPLPPRSRTLMLMNLRFRGWAGFPKQ